VAITVSHDEAVSTPIVSKKPSAVLPGVAFAVAAVLTVAVVIGAIVTFVAQLVTYYDVAPLQSISADLRSGEWELSSADPNARTACEAAQVKTSGGEQIPVLCYTSAGATTDLNGKQRDYFGKFTLDRAERVTVTSLGPAISFSAGPGIAAEVALPWIIGAIVLGLLALALLVWWIVRLTRRTPTPATGSAGGPYPYGASAGPQAMLNPEAPGNASPAWGSPSTAPGMGVTPGWYADPQDPARWRWWDGQRWTQYTS